MPKTYLPIIVAGLVLAVAQGAAPTALGQAVTVADHIEVTAVVETVDQTTRQVLLRGSEGGLLTMVVGPEVRNLAQVRSGDRVTARYRQAVAVDMARPGGPPLAAAAGAARAEPGQRPAGVAAEAVRARVRIDRVDAARDVVHFTGPGGIPRAVQVQEPEMRAFIRTLSPADEVDVTFSEAVAVTVEAMPR